MASIIEILLQANEGNAAAVFKTIGAAALEAANEFKQTESAAQGLETGLAGVGQGAAGLEQVGQAAQTASAGMQQTGQAAATLTSQVGAISQGATGLAELSTAAEASASSFAATGEAATALGQDVASVGQGAAGITEISTAAQSLVSALEAAAQAAGNFVGSLGGVGAGAAGMQETAAAADQVAASTDRASTAMRGLGAGLGVGLLGLAGVFGLATNAALTQEQQIRELEAAYGDAAEQMDAFARKLQGSSIFSTSDIREGEIALSSLARNYGLTADQVQNLLQVTANLATVYGVGFDEAATRMRQAMEGNARGAAALGLSLKSNLLVQQGQVISATDAMGGAQSRYTAIMQQATFANGEAASEAEKGRGVFENFANSVQQEAANIGQSLGPIPALLTSLGTGFIGLTGLGNAFTGIGSKAKEAAAGIRETAVAQGLMEAVTSPLGLAVAAVGVAAAAGIAIWHSHADAAKQTAQDYKDLQVAIDAVNKSIGDTRNAGETLLAQQETALSQRSNAVFDETTQHIQDDLNKLKAGTLDLLSTTDPLMQGIWADLAGKHVDPATNPQVAAQQVGKYLQAMIGEVQKGKTQIDTDLSTLFGDLSKPNIDAPRLLEQIGMAIDTFKQTHDSGAFVGGLEAIIKAVDAGGFAMDKTAQDAQAMADSLDGLTDSARTVTIAIDDLRMKGLNQQADDVSRLQNLWSGFSDGLIQASDGAKQYEAAQQRIFQAEENGTVNSKALNDRIAQLQLQWATGQISADQYGAAIVLLSENLSQFPPVVDAAAFSLKNFSKGLADNTLAMAQSAAAAAQQSPMFQVLALGADEATLHLDHMRLSENELATAAHSLFPAIATGLAPIDQQLAALDTHLHTVTASFQAVGDAALGAHYQDVVDYEAAIAKGSDEGALHLDHMRQSMEAISTAAHSAFPAIATGLGPIDQQLAALDTHLKTVTTSFQAVGDAALTGHYQDILDYENAIAYSSGQAEDHLHHMALAENELATAAHGAGLALDHQAVLNAAATDTTALLEANAKALVDVYTRVQKAQADAIKGGLDLTGQSGLTGMLALAGIGDKVAGSLGGSGSAIDTIASGLARLSGAGQHASETVFQLANNMNIANAAMTDGYRVVVQNTDAIAKQSDELLKWADDLIAPIGTYSKLDDLLAAHTITLQQYNAAQQAEIQITADNARVQQDVLTIQAKQAPVLADLATQQANYLDQVAKQSGVQQAASLAAMDQNEQLKAQQALTLATSAANGELGASGKAMATELIQGAVSADPYLSALLQQMGLIKVGADGKVTVEFPNASSLTKDIHDLTTSIDALTRALGGVPPLHISTNAAEVKAQLDAMKQALLGVGQTPATPPASVGRAAVGAAIGAVSVPEAVAPPIHITARDDATPTIKHVTDELIALAGQHAEPTITVRTDQINAALDGLKSLSSDTVSRGFGALNTGLEGAVGRMVQLAGDTGFYTLAADKAQAATDDVTNGLISLGQQSRTQIAFPIAKREVDDARVAIGGALNAVRDFSTGLDGLARIASNVPPLQIHAEDHATSVLIGVQAHAAALDGMKAGLHITADAAPAEAGIGIVRAGMGALDGLTALTYVNGDPSGAEAGAAIATGAVGAVDGLTAGTFELGDPSGAIGAAADASGAVSAVDGATAMLYVDGDASGALGAIAEAAAYDGATVATVYVDMAVRNNTGLDAAAAGLGFAHGGVVWADTPPAQAFVPIGIPHAANGIVVRTQEQGGELEILPNGTYVMPHGETLQKLRSNPGLGGPVFNLTINGHVYGIDDLNRQVAAVLLPAIAEAYTDQRRGQGL